MIKIFLKDEKKISKNHVKELSKICKNKLGFLILFFNSTNNNCLKTYLPQEIHLKTKLSLINKLLKTEIKFLNNNTFDFKDIYSNNKSEILVFLKNIESNQININNKNRDILDCILDSKISEFESIENQIYSKLNTLNKNDVKDLISWVFNYTSFRDSDYCYLFAKNLNVNVCPYCNRLYTNTVTSKGKQIIKPTFDHFYDKGTHPLFSISFYNLIPSCSICNSNLKGTEIFTYKTHINPYEEGFDEDGKFIVKSLSDLNNLKIKIEVRKKNKLKIKNNVKVFKLQEIYQASHIDIVKNLAYKFRNETYETLFTNNTIKTLGLSNKKSIYEFYTSNLYETKDFQNRPLSKFTKDIFDDLLSKGYAKEFEKLS